MPIRNPDGMQILTDNVLEFNQRLHAAMLEFPKSANVIKRKVALDVLAGVIRDSPVDTGRFRNNWQASIIRPERSEKDAGSGAAAVASGAATIARVQPGQNLYLSNNVPYAERIEEGWSEQAPKGVLALNLARVSMGLVRA